VREVRELFQALRYPFQEKLTVAGTDLSVSTT
jgi:hypothetical protein